MRPAEILLGILLLWLGSGAVLGAAPIQPLEVWSLGEGWEQNTVTAVVQSREGYLWLGTYHGLARFDGVRFTVFDASNTEGLRNGLITSLYEDPQGTLWIGHETGELTRCRAGRFQAARPGRPWPGGPIEALSGDEHGDVWLLNDSGLLFRWRDGRTLQCPGGASPSRKASLTCSSAGQIWIVSNGRVAVLEHGELVERQFDSEPGTEFYERVLPTRDGGLWVLGAGRLREWRDGHWAAELPGCPKEPGAATVMWELRSGAVAVGTLNSGLYLFTSGAEPLRFSRTNGLSHDWIRAVCEDREGNLWLGTGSGFNGLRPRKVTMVNAPDAWQGCGILSFAALADHSAWVGTEGAGLYHYQRGQWSNYGPASGLSNLFVWAVLETKAGQLYAGTWGGGLLVKAGETFGTEGELAKISAPVASLFEGRDGAIWIGTTIGLYRYESGRLAWHAGKDKLTLPDVRAITEAADGTLWFGMSGGGLGRLKDGALSQFRKRDGLCSDFIVSLYSDPDGTLWIGSSDNGLGRLKEGKFATISTAQGLPSVVLSHIVDDGAGNLWLGSHMGILRARKADLNLCAEGQISAVHFQSYGKAEGMASLICSGGFQPGACKTAAGELWFPTAKGLAIVDPARVTTNHVAPPVIIEELLVGSPSGGVAERIPVWASGEPATGPARSFPPPLSEEGDQEGAASPASRLRIPPGRRHLELHYTAPSFVAPDKVRFKYRLEGLEREWTDAGAKRVAQYSYLPPGAYRFQVIACNNDEVWNETGATLAFTVLPFFWQTWWFQAGSISGGAGLFGAGVLWAGRRRLRRKYEQLERQRALERERARIARDIHDDLGASLTRITMLSQSIRSEVERQPATAADVDQIYTTARELTRAMDEIVWAVNPKHDTLDSLATYLGRYAQNFLSAAGLRCRLDVPVNLPPWALTSEVRHNVFLAFKEALHNVIKHAAATEVHISLEMGPDRFTLLIADNGRGFDPNLPRVPGGHPADALRLAGGNGLANMRKRLEEIGGACEWITSPGEGTRVRLVVHRHA